MVNGIFSILSTYYFTFIPGLNIHSQKFKLCIQYDTGLAFSSNMQGPFFKNKTFCVTPSFTIDFTLLLTTKSILFQNI